jgi:hypothetical protein
MYLEAFHLKTYPFQVWLRRYYRGNRLWQDHPAQENTDRTPSKRNGSQGISDSD